MKNSIRILSKVLAALFYVFGAVALVVSILLTTIYHPASAAEGNEVDPSSEEVHQVEACTPPPGWDQTTRLFYQRQTTKEWTFEVPEQEMDVVLEFFYFQDYDTQGCPFDCSTGQCQIDEIGQGSSPLGEFVIEDGHEGAADGVIRQSGRLTQGTYQASFRVTGQGSINIGLRVHRQAVPTPTPTDEVLPPVPTATHTPIPTEEVLPPVPTATNTPTPTGEVLPPVQTATFTPTPTTEEVLPPVPTATFTPTPTATERVAVREPAPTRTPTPPATLAPPAPPATGEPSVLIPETGADLLISQAVVTVGLDLTQRLLLKFGVGLLGLALIFHGLSNKLR